VTEAISIGAIGYRNHAGRILRIVEESGLATVKRIYHPIKVIQHLDVTNDIRELYECDAVFILSPDHTHSYYLKCLSKEYRGYIFCEKPPAVKMAELNELNVICARRTYFNFNLRHSKLYELSQQIYSQGSIGKVLRIEATSSHGLAFRPEYTKTWRAAGSNLGLGVAGTKSIHYFDLIMQLFGKPNWVKTSACRGSDRTTDDDTCTISFTYPNGVTGTIFSSYAAPYNDRFVIYGTDGQIEYNGKTLNYIGPRDSFDNHGRFCFPPTKLLHDFKDNNMWTDSLQKSVYVFLKYAASLSDLPLEWFRSSLESNKSMLLSLNVE